ncbi:MAG: ABC transporter ATP-binding protein, partial [Actinobacteria bacterium]|nr:ABC transporter ATP-binding protein [Actinomycetota bacterium]
GDLHGLIGPNGAGKTTLFNLMTGVLFPTQGKILFHGREITRMPTHHRVRLGIGRSFQVPQPFFNMTVEESVMTGTHVHYRSEILASVFRTRSFREEESQASAKARELLAFVGLEDRAGIACGNLSCGQQRLLELARALATKPSLLLLDEPFAGLTTSEKRDLAALLTRINEDTTILLVEHDMKIVMGLCHKLTVLNFGRVIARGSPTEIQENPDVITAYLGRAAASA